MLVGFFNRQQHDHKTLIKCHVEIAIIMHPSHEAKAK